jgi:hypothetical protein
MQHSIYENPFPSFKAKDAETFPSMCLHPDFPAVNLIQQKYSKNLRILTVVGTNISFLLNKYPFVFHSIILCQFYRPFNIEWELRKIIEVVLLRFKASYHSLQRQSKTKKRSIRCSLRIMLSEYVRCCSTA